MGLTVSVRVKEAVEEVCRLDLLRQYLGKQLVENEVELIEVFIRHLKPHLIEPILLLILCKKRLKVLVVYCLLKELNLVLLDHLLKELFITEHEREGLLYHVDVVGVMRLEDSQNHT